MINKALRRRGTTYVSNKQPDTFPFGTYGREAPCRMSRQELLQAEEVRSAGS